jgi:hypothetical protein
MNEFDVNPIEELGFAKNAIVRVIEANQKDLLPGELIMLKLACQGINLVQQTLYDNEW